MFSSRQIFENLKFELQINLEIKKNKKPEKNREINMGSLDRILGKVRGLADKYLKTASLIETAVYWSGQAANLSHGEEQDILRWAESLIIAKQYHRHSIYIRTITFYLLLSALLNWFELVSGLFVSPKQLAS